MEKYIEEYKRWVSNDEIKEDKEMFEALLDMRWETEDIKKNFSSYLRFGTSGLRGVMGAGTDKMNVYIVRKVTQGIANYMVKTFEDPTYIIAYDSRRNSRKFAEAAAEVMAGNGIPVYIFPEMVPVPVLSYAIRKLDACLGLAVTASHNTAEYNGYKVYNGDGYQITGSVPDDILAEIEKVDIFDDVRRMDFEDAMRFSICTYVDDSIIDGYFNAVDEIAFSRMKRKTPQRLELNNNRILYTSLFGAGYKFVKRACPDFEIVESQIEHDGSFPGVPYPNPEKKEAFEEAIKVADEKGIDYILATDPDSDRFGMAIRTDDGFRVLTGNEIAVLMFNYICESRKLPRGAVALRSLVSTLMADAIAADYKVDMKTTLTGFKYIGEKICGLSDPSKFVFAFEESNGFLMGIHAADKDGVMACAFAQQMIDWYGNVEKALNNLYAKYGYYVNSLYEYVGDMKYIADVMAGLREKPLYPDCAVRDFLEENSEYPISDILCYSLGDGCRIYIRPSGTEPKLKAYIFAKATSAEKAESKADEIRQKLIERVEAGNVSE